MAKGKAKINSTEDLLPLQTRPLRSRKRESPRDESSVADDVQTTVHQKNPNKGNTGGPILYPQQDCLVITESSCLPEWEDHTKDKNTAAAGQEETTAANVDDLQSHGTHTDEDTEEQIPSEDCRRSPNPNHVDQLQVSQPSSRNDEDSAELEKQVGEKELSIQESNKVKESATGLPAKKKRRMGMCGLTEKERSQFLQAQSGQNGTESTRRQICPQTTKLQAFEEEVWLPSSCGNISAVGVMDQSESTPQHPSSHGGEAHGPGSEVLVAVTISDGTGCNGGSPPGPEHELTHNPQSRHAEEEEQKLLQECKEPTAEMFEKQTSMEQNQLAEVQSSSAVTSDTSQKEDKDKEAVGDALPHMNTERGTRGNEKGETSSDGAEDEASSADTQPEGLVKICEASSVPELKAKCDPQGDSAARPPEQTHTKESDDLDYVSDSQLNTIVLVDEKMMEKEPEKEDPDPSGCLKDASELICGLIRELSSLNQKVMGAHREVEKLRRKSSRRSVC
ncbi:uncharacterized protein [Nothobranchius furzeri]|uniref:uncharacterized protein n=1 Tax=Nothobranchius furzeri TaxID=105023 RepID=UPI003904AD9D